MRGYMYILECSDGSYYAGSTNNLELRMQQHQNGEGANHTKKRLPVKLVYSEEYYRIDHAFLREKQVQGWSRKKKEALIRGQYDLLPELARNYAQYGVPSTVSAVPSTGSGTVPASLYSSKLIYEELNSIQPVTELVEGTTTKIPS